MHTFGALSSKFPSSVYSMAAMSDDSRLVGKPAIVHKNEDAWEGGALRC